MKSSVAHQKACLPIALASLNNGHSSDLHTYCASVGSSSRPNLVPTRPLRLHNAAWQSSLITNLNNTTLGRALAAKAKAHIVANHCCVATMTLARNFILPCSNFMLSRCTSSFSILSFLASKPMRHRLSLCSSCLGALAKVSTT